MKEFRSLRPARLLAACVCACVVAHCGQNPASEPDAAAIADNGAAGGAVDALAVNPQDAAAGSDADPNEVGGPTDAGSSDSAQSGDAAAHDAAGDADSLIAPAVEIQQVAAKCVCTVVAAAPKPPAGATMLFSWRKNQGPWHANAAGDAAFAGAATACDRLQCKVELKAGGQTALSPEASLQLPMGTACATGNVCAPGACNPEGGCAAPPQTGNCDDGEPCTLGETCTGGLCKAPPKTACTDWFEDKDSDGAGAKALGCLCVAPAGPATMTTGDCDDTLSTTAPGAKEICDGVDQDCNGKIDENACGALLPPEAKEFKTESPMVGDSYDVTASASLDAGAFGEVQVKGKVEKKGKDQPVTYCMSGPAQLPAGAPLQLTEATLTVCKTPDGQITRTIVGNVVFDGSKAAVTGSFTVAVGATPALLTLKAIGLSIFGLDATNVTLTWVQGATTVAVDGSVAVPYLGQKLAATLAGSLTPVVDGELALTFPQSKGTQMTGGVAPTPAAAVIGSRTRTKGTLWTNLSLSAGPLPLGQTPQGAKLSTKSWSTVAKRSDGSAWSLALSATDTTVPPMVGLALDGTWAAEEAAPATTTVVCLQGPTGVVLPVPGIDGKPAPLTVRQCWQNGQALATQWLAGIVDPVAGQTALTGELTPGAPLCVQGVGAKALPAVAVGTGQAAAPSAVTVRYCLAADYASFVAAQYGSKVAVPGLGTLDMVGPAQAGGGVCLAANTTLTLTGPAPAKLPVTVQVCADAGLTGATALATAVLDFGGFAALPATATLGGPAATLCFEAKPPTVASFDAAATLLAQRCWDASANAMAAASFTLSAAAPAFGKLALNGVHDPAANGGKGALCLGSTDLLASTATAPVAKALLPLLGVQTVQAQLSSCLGSDGKTFSAPMLTYSVVSGDPKADGVALRISATLDASAGLCELAGGPTGCAAAEKAWRGAEPDPLLHVDDRYRMVGATCVDTLAKAADSCTTAANGSKPAWNFAVADAAGKVVAKPALRHTVALLGCAAQQAGPCTSVWTPYKNLAIGSPYDVRTAGHSNLTGYVAVRDGLAWLDVRAKADSIGEQSKTPVGQAELLVQGGTVLAALKAVGSHLQVDAAGKLLARLTGHTLLNLTGQGFAPWNVPAYVEGQPGPTGVILQGVVLPKGCLSGTCTYDTVDPLGSLIGKDRFVLGGKAGALVWSVPWLSQKTQPMQLDVDSHFDVHLPDNDKVTVSGWVRALWRRNESSGALGAMPEMLYAAPIAEQKMQAGKWTIKLGSAKNKLGQLESRPTVVVASSHSISDYQLDLDGDPANGKEATWILPAGLTIRSTAVLDAVGAYFGNPTATIDISWYAPTKFKLEGKLDVDWALITPGSGIPTVESAKIDEVFARIEFPGTIRVFIGGKIQMVTIDRLGNKDTLMGLAQFEADATGALGGTIALTGLWKNPFWIPNVALFNVGISAKLMPVAPPVPTAFGYTAQGILLKDKLDAPWPKIAGNKFNSPVGVNPDGTLMDTLPKNMTTVGLSNYFDVVPSKSGFCYLPGACLSMPPLLSRIDIQNIGTDDIAWLANLLTAGLKRLVDEAKTVRVLEGGKWVDKKAPWAPLLNALPLGGELPKVNMGPVSFELDRLLYYVSTHNQERFGVNWPFGMKFRGDARFKVPAGPDKGQEKKVKVRGSMNIWGGHLAASISPMQLLPGFKLLGDPYRRRAMLNGGYLRIPTTSADWNWGTFEGTFRDTSVATGGVLYERKGKTSGLRIAVDELAPPCDEGAIDQDGNALDCKTPVGRIVVTLTTDDPKVPANQRIRTVKTKRGVLVAATEQHVAVVRDPDTHDVLIYINGDDVLTLDSADGADGEPNTADDLARFALPTTASAETQIGKNFEAVDDLRLWSVKRDPADIDREARDLPKGYHNDKTLIARWESDFDRELDVVGGSVALRNSKTGASTQYDGSYMTPAKPDIDPANQDLRFKYLWPFKNPFNTGWQIFAGLDLKLPQAALDLSGNPDGITVGCDLAYITGQIGGRLYVRELTLVPAGKGSGFVLTGDGPNGIAGDWDDGLYLEANFPIPDSLDVKSDNLPTIDASAKLAFDWQSKRHPILSAAIKLGCLKKNPDGTVAFKSEACALGNGYHLYIKTLLGANGNLSVDLGSGLGKLGIDGTFTLSTLDAPVLLHVKGGLKVFGRQIADAELKIDGKGINALAAIDLGVSSGVNLGLAQQLAVSYQWTPARLCAIGNTLVDIPALAKIDGVVDMCFGDNPHANFAGTAKVGSFGNIPVADLAVKLGSSTGLEITKARLHIGPIFDADIKGYFKGAKDFDVQGTVKADLTGVDFLTATATARILSNQSGVAATLGAIVDSAGGGNWLSGALTGSFEFANGKFYYSVVGDANFKPGGFQAASGRAWLCNPKDAQAPTTPTECKVGTAVGAEGVLNIGIAKLKVGAALSTGKTNGVAWAEFAGSAGLKLTMHKVITLDSTLTVTGKKMGGKLSGGVDLDGKFALMGMSSPFSVPLLPNVGEPKPFEIKGSGTLTPFAGFPLANGEGYLKVGAGGTTSAGASGTLSMVDLFSTTMSAAFNTNGSANWAGTATLKLAKLLESTTSLSLGSAGVAFDSNFKADTQVIKLGVDIAGTIPKDGKYNFAGDGWVQLTPFPQTQFADFQADSVNGFAGNATLDLKVVKMAIKTWAGKGADGIGISGAATLSTWKVGTFLYQWIETVVKDVANKISGWDCSDYCVEKVLGECVLKWFHCKKDETKSSDSEVSASVTFTLSGTSYKTNANVKLDAKATLTAGKWSGSSTTTCQMGTQPQCCFPFPDPIGKQCLKLY